MLSVALAGCAEDAGTPDEPDANEPPVVEATETTGGIRGVVVDTAILPIADADVLVTPGDLKTTSDENGNFVLSGLEPGTYFVVVSHPLYDTVQQSTEVVAGVAEPAAIKFRLTRLVNFDPYLSTQPFKGYITCSANLVFVLSEECGEGVGVSGQGRVGKNDNNKAQIDFQIESDQVKSLIAEAHWKPSTSVGAPGAQSGGFNMGIYVDFSCLPVCDWSYSIDRKNSNSPMYLRNDERTAELGPNEETLFSTFTWAASDETGVLLEQEFDVFVTASYGLPLPEEWSFINGDDNPFS